MTPVAAVITVCSCSVTLSVCDETLSLADRQTDSDKIYMQETNRENVGRRPRIPTPSIVVLIIIIITILDGADGI